MNIFPAIDIYEGKAVRLYKGDYSKMTVYSNNPPEIAKAFINEGAEYIHIVDLEGAKSGNCPNIKTVENIVKTGKLFCEIGGGIRTENAIEQYLSIGVNRIILGTAAVKDKNFLQTAVKKYDDKIAVGIDIKDGYAATNGWTEKSSLKAREMFEVMQNIGVKNIICTDISKDGAMQGTNIELYKELNRDFSVNITASGGISSIEDIKNLVKLGIYGAIVGKAYYIGAISLKDAIEVAK